MFDCGDITLMLLRLRAMLKTHQQYFRTINCTFHPGDFIMAAQHFGVAHPPGYPLYVTAGYLWMKLLPFGNPAFKLNVLTSFIGGLAAFVVYLTAFK